MLEERMVALSAGYQPVQSEWELPSVTSFRGTLRMEAVAKCALEQVHACALSRDRLIRRVLYGTDPEHGEFRHFYGNVIIDSAHPLFMSAVRHRDLLPPPVARPRASEEVA